MSNEIMWGRTGRVTIQGPITSSTLPGILVDGLDVGWLYTPDDWHPLWGTRAVVPGRPGIPSGVLVAQDLPNLDAAVAWVLRRAAPDVWRQERGPVWRVASGCIRFGYCQCRYHWHIYRPDGSKHTDNGSTEGASGWHWAMREVATERAREATR